MPALFRYYKNQRDDECLSSQGIVTTWSHNSKECHHPLDLPKRPTATTSETLWCQLPAATTSETLMLASSGHHQWDFQATAGHHQWADSLMSASAATTSETLTCQLPLVQSVLSAERLSLSISFLPSFCPYFLLIL